jgi:hypothetical protein
MDRLSGEFERGSRDVDGIDEEQYGEQTEMISDE